MATLGSKAQKLAEAVAKHDVCTVRSLLAPDALLHQGNSPPLDMRKADAVKSLKNQWAMATAGSSEVLATAVNEADKCSFALVWYKDIGLACAPDAGQPHAGVDVVAIWLAIWTEDGTAVKELVVHSCTPKKTAIEGAPPFDAALFTRVASGAAGNESVHKAAAAAAAFCDLYDDADWDRVPSVLTEDFVEWRPVTNKCKVGFYAVEENLKLHKKCWKAAKEARHVAAADASSAFLAWASLGYCAENADGAFDTTAPPMLFTGMCFMLLDDAGQVTKSVHLEIPEPKTAPLRWTGF